MKKETFRHRLGTAGLNDMIRDPRYMDGADPEHDSVKNAVGRGFRMLFDDGKPHPADSTPAPASGLFDDAMARIIGPEPSDPEQDTPILQMARNAMAQDRMMLSDAGAIKSLTPEPTGSHAEKLGRRVMTSALHEDNERRDTLHKMPSGFEEPDADKAIRRAAKTRTRLAQRAEVGERPEPAKPAAAQKGQEKTKSPPFKTHLSEAFLHTIHKQESDAKNYQAYHKGGDAWGRYQLTEFARKQIGLQEKEGSFKKGTGRFVTGPDSLAQKYGIKSMEDFLNNPAAQEEAMADYMKDNHKQLKSKGATKYIGQTIDGIKAKITITESGLLAAGHRAGAQGTLDYLNHLKKHDWKSDRSTFPPGKIGDMFLAAETRLREFEKIRYRRDTER
jgi:hypothetical protein